MIRRSTVNLLCRAVITVKTPAIRLSRSQLTLRPALRYYSVGSTDGHAIPNEVLKLTTKEYHQASDTFLETLLDDLEALSEDLPDVVPDVELTQGVMTLQVAPVGTYVINKQPPNKQIWLSSPVSGPNRFDLCRGEWVSLRDGARLLDVLNSELQQATGHSL